MKERRPRKARNMAAKALRECKLFAPKTIPAKKGRGAIYSRKGRIAEKGPSGLCHFWLTKFVRTGYGLYSIVHA